MTPLVRIAGKEMRQALRNRWLLAAVLLLAALGLAIAFLGSAPTGNVGASRLDVMTLGLVTLSTFVVPLIALLLAHDAIVGEIESGTMLLLLAYPVRRGEVLFGKFLGHLAVIALAVVLGYLVAAAALAVSGGGTGGGWPAFARMLATSVLLGAAFLAIGYAASSGSASRGAAAGIALGVWLVFVILYDMALLAILVADHSGWIGAGTFRALLLFNPADSYRLLNLAGSADAALLSGLSGLPDGAMVPAAVSLAVLLGWAALPLALAVRLFGRREI